MPLVEIDSDIQDQLEAEGLLREFEGADLGKLGRAAAVALRQWADDKKSQRVTLIAAGRRYENR